MMVTGTLPIGAAVLRWGSLFAVTLLVIHLFRNLGRRRSVIAISVGLAYGIVRGALVRGIAESGLGGNAPYAFGGDPLSLFGVPLQEPIGWILGALFAFWIGERIICWLGIAAAPARTALAGAVVLASLSLAVEEAAARAGWWIWSMAPTKPLSIPGIALVDWGFVAFDLLLPLLVIGAKGSTRAIVLSCLAFPVHFGSHLLVGSLGSWLPVSIFDLVHVAIPSAVVIGATFERNAALLPESAAQRSRWLPTAAAVGVVLVTFLAGDGGIVGRALSVLPFAVLALLASLRPPSPGATRRFPFPRSASEARIAIALGAAFVLLVFLVPSTVRNERYLERMRRGAALMSKGDGSAAERELRSAIELRPEHPAARCLLAVLRLREGRRDDARRELQGALAEHPTSAEALRLLACVELMEGRRAPAAELAALGRRAHPRNADFLYLVEFVEQRAGPGHPASLPAVALARQGGASRLSSLAVVARTLGDEATAAACSEPGVSRGN